MYSTYKLVSKNTDKVYIGKTRQTFGARKSGHRNKYKRWINGKFEANGERAKYCGSYDVMKFGDWDMIEIEANIEEENVVERERYWIENTENTTNKVIPGRTDKQYNIDNRIRKSAYNKKRDKTKINLGQRVLHHCPFCSMLVKRSYMSDHQGKSKRTKGKKCKKAQEARIVIFRFMLRIF